MIGESTKASLHGADNVREEWEYLTADSSLSDRERVLRGVLAYRNAFGDMELRGLVEHFTPAVDPQIAHAYAEEWGERREYAHDCDRELITEHSTAALKRLVEKMDGAVTYRPLSKSRTKGKERVKSMKRAERSNTAAQRRQQAEVVRLMDEQGLSREEAVAAWEEAERARTIAPDGTPIMPEVPQDLGQDKGIYQRKVAESIAGTFLRSDGRQARYVGPWGKWITWDGRRWCEDETNEVFHWCGETAAAMSAAAEDDGVRHRMQTSSYTAGVERFCRSWPGVAIVPASLDADPWVLNTAGGIVDLRTGEIVPSGPAHLCMKMARGNPRKDATCPRFDEFLDQITQSNQELIAFLWRMLGSTLVGKVIDHALYFFHGEGKNGKGTLVDVVADVLGSYCMPAPTGLLTAQKTERHETELASLQGRRLVYADEIDAFARWNEQRIKSLTGGGTITARLMRQDHFQFPPSHSFIVVANNRPQFSHIDDAIRRRLYLIPFDFKVKKIDLHLRETLAGEADGILRGLINGCLIWQRDGLQPPAVVREATSAYLDDEDYVSRWMSERCIVEENARLNRTEAFTNFRGWCEVHNLRAGSANDFYEEMKKRGYAWKMSCGDRFLPGIKLKLIDIGNPWKAGSSPGCNVDSE